MFIIRMVYSEYLPTPEKIVQCPNCGEESSFYSRAPTICSMCSTIIPNAMRLIENENNARANFHMKGGTE